MMKKKLTIIGLCGIAVLPLDVSASPISVSVAGTANETKMGYTQGESYTFTWVVNDGYTGSDGIGDGGDIFNSIENLWFSTSTNDPWVFSSVSGAGLVGTYTKPITNNQAPFEQLLVNSAGLRCWAATKTVSITMGLLVDGAEVWNIVAYDLTIPGLDYSDALFVNPTTYLENYSGTYSSIGGGIYLDNENMDEIEFTATSVTIGVVPEPSTFLLLGIGGLGAWILRKNRLKNEEDGE